MTKIEPLHALLNRVVYSDAAANLVLGPLAAWGYRRHRITGATPRLAYSAMRKAYGAPSGRRFERLAASVRERPLLRLEADPSGLAGGCITEVVQHLERDGFAILERRLGEADCADLEAVARRATCRMVAKEGVVGRGTFDELAPEAVRYDLDEEDVLDSRAAQRIVADESLLAVAQKYLGAAPIQDLVAMWWSAPGGGEASAAAAQQFHFDLDRLRFVKVFVFVTDVDKDRGPHVYVRGTHRQVAAALRQDGRHSDDEVQRLHGDDVVTITGARGTVFLADTRALHKGQDLRSGHRLVFQTEYASSLFGSPYGTPSVRAPIPELRAAAERHPWTFQRFRGL